MGTTTSGFDNSMALGYWIDVEYETTTGIEAVNAIDAMTDHPREPKDKRKWSGRLFNHARVALSCGAAVSRMLWPAGQSVSDRGSDNPARRVQFRKERGEWLRKELAVSDTDLPTIRSRAVRNAFEHADERMDDIALSGFVGNVVDHSVYSPDDFLVQSPSPIQIVRLIDPEKHILYFGDDSIDLFELRTELQSVHETVRSKYKPHPWPPQK
jgi:hypothetical protein